MGKKAQLKKIRRMAESLPSMEVNGTTPTTITTGTALLEKGITVDLAGKAVDPSKTYIFPEKQRKELDHYKRMKKALKTHGLEGAKSYVGSVHQFRKNQANEHNLSQ